MRSPDTSVDPGVLVPAGPGPPAPGLWWRERTSPLTLPCSRGLCRGQVCPVACRPSNPVAAPAPRTCATGVGWAEPAWAAVSEARAAGWLAGIPSGLLVTSLLCPFVRPTVSAPPGAPSMASMYPAHQAPPLSALQRLAGFTGSSQRLLWHLYSLETLSL